MTDMKRPPLLSDDEIERYSMMYTIPSRYETARALKHAKGIYEAARDKDEELIGELTQKLDDANRLAQNWGLQVAKDAELIQQLVDALRLTKDALELHEGCECDGVGCILCRIFDKGDNALFAAKDAGFKPSND